MQTSTEETEIVTEEEVKEVNAEPETATEGERDNLVKIDQKKNVL